MDQESPIYSLGEKISAVGIWFDNILAIGDSRYEKSYNQCLELAREQRIQEEYDFWFNG